MAEVKTIVIEDMIVVFKELLTIHDELSKTSVIYQQLMREDFPMVFEEGNTKMHFIDNMDFSNNDGPPDPNNISGLLNYVGKTNSALSLCILLIRFVYNVTNANETLDRAFAETFYNNCIEPTYKEIYQQEYGAEAPPIPDDAKQAIYDVIIDEHHKLYQETYEQQ